MKRITIAFLAASLAALTVLSCKKEPNEEPPQDPQIQVMTPTVEVPAEGGAFEVTYTVQNAVEWVEMTASSEAEWITDIDCSVDGKVTFNVQANDVTEVREGTIVLKYGSVVAQAAVSQQGKAPSEYDVEFEAPLFYGIYYGDYFVDGVGNYWFYLMDKEMVDDVMSPDARYYRIDLYAPLAEDPANASVPDGTYVFDKESTNAEGTFSKAYSYLITTDAAGKGTAHDYTEGSLVVKNEGEVTTFELIVTIEGKKHKVTYTGAAHFMDDSGDEPDVEYPQITSDVTMTALSAEAYWVADNNGVASIDMRIMDMEKDGEGYPIYPGLSLDIDLYGIIEDDGGIKAGEYVISKNNAGDEGTLAPGSVSSLFGMYIPSGTNLQQYDEEGNRAFGVVTDGKLTISGTASEATITVDMTMEGKYSLTTTYTGPLQVKNIPSSAVAPALRASKPLR